MTAWSKFLNESGTCHEDEVGNRPCDNGCICDRCHADYIQEAFESWKKEKKINE